MAVISIKNKTKSGSLLNGNAPYIPNDYESIATVTVGAGGVSSVSFSSIPSTYQHLQVRFIARSTSAGTADPAVVRLNGISSSTYSIHYLWGDGSSANAAATTSYSYTYGGYLPASGATASVFGASVWDLLDYSNTNKYKTIRSLNGVDTNGAGNARFTSGLVQTTDAISSITFTTDNAANFAQYSSFALYGIKG
jgi:hypothetical protein